MAPPVGQSIDKESSARLGERKAKTIFLWVLWAPAPKSKKRKEGPTRHWFHTKWRTASHRRPMTRPALRVCDRLLTLGGKRGTEPFASGISGIDHRLASAKVERAVSANGDRAAFEAAARAARCQTCRRRTLIRTLLLEPCVPGDAHPGKVRELTCSSRQTPDVRPHVDSLGQATIALGRRGERLERPVSRCRRKIVKSCFVDFSQWGLNRFIEG